MVNQMMTRLSLTLAIGSLLAGVARAGSLEPPGSPAPTMVTQQQLWDAAKPPGCFNNSPSGLRFVDCGNGTVQDTQTGLVWLKNADCLPAGGSDWAAANRRAAKLADGTADGNACGLSDGSKAGMWRLPTIAEWQALSFAFSSACNPSLPAASGTGCYSAGAWATGVLSDYYWSSSTYVSNPNMVSIVYLGNGFVGNFPKDGTHNVWPVRGGP